MSQKKSNSYTAEFKEAAVKLAVESDQPVTQTARELGVNVNTLHTWISKFHGRQACDSNEKASWCYVAHNETSNRPATITTSPCNLGKLTDSRSQIVPISTPKGILTWRSATT